MSEAVARGRDDAREKKDSTDNGMQGSKETAGSQVPDPDVPSTFAAQHRPESGSSEEIEALMGRVKVINADLAAAMKKKKMFRMAIRVLHNRIPEDPRASHSADTVEIFHNLHSCHAEIEILDQSVETKGQELLAMSSKIRGQDMDKEQKKRWGALVMVGLDIARSNETDEGMW